MRFIATIIITIICGAAAWDDGDLEVFDVVEEVNNQNFYEFMGVTQEASSAEIKSAFKKLTLKLHPDKNDAPDAEVQFRNLVSIHNILKDPGKREKYNDVLKNGLPNWRSAVYYYRHVRKMGLAEGSIIIFIIVTFGQYAVGWAAYVEKRYTAEQILNSRAKKTKKSGFDAGLAEVLEQLPRPSIRDTLPFQIPYALWWMVTGVPRAVLEIQRQVKMKREEAAKEKLREQEACEEAERAAAAAAAARAARGEARRRRQFVPPQCEREAAPRASVRPESSAPAPAVVSGGFWSDDDLAELVRLVKRHPPGAPERWERIAAAMLRPVPEVTHMAAKLKDNCYKLPDQESEPPPEPPKKVKTRADDAAGAGGSWSQAQQKALETALARHPKGGAGDRWEKIANAVPGKTKEECMQRCKYLSDLVRRQKREEEERLQEEAREDITIATEREFDT